MTMKIFVFPLFFAALVAVGSSGLPGGLSNIDTNSQEFRSALEFAVDEYNSRSNSVYYRKLIRVISAQSQVVAGVNIFMTLDLARTYCYKTDPFRDYCPIAYPRQFYQCSFVVFVALERGGMRLSEENCSNL